MSSSDKREIQKRLERASMPPHIPTSFPGVSPEGYLVSENARSLPSPSRVLVSSPRRQKNKKAERIFDGSEHTEVPNQKPRRRAEIERQIRQDPYHALLEGGELPRDSDVIDGAETDVQRHEQSPAPREESPNTQQSGPAAPAPVAERLAERPRPPMVSVLCGRQDAKSCYLTRRLVRMPANDGDDLASLLKEQNIDPDAAELHRLWRHTGIIPTRYRDINFDPNGMNPQHTWIACWPLINAAIHGYMLEDFEFVDRVMDLLEEKIVKGVRPDVDTILHVFGEKRQLMPTMLQRFLVDRWVDNSTRGFEDVDPYILPELFVCTALDTATRRLSHVAQPPPLSRCQYHAHSKSAECYKNRNMQAEAIRQERYKYRREKATREAEKAAADSIEYGIRTVDWEARRAEAHRALHDQVDEYLLATSSWTKIPDQEVRGNASGNLELTDDAPAAGKGKGPESRLKFGSSSPSMFATAQPGGAVNEVKIAPPTREPPPPPPTNMLVDRHDDDIGRIQSFEKLPTQRKVAMHVPLDSDALPVAESMESPTLDAPALPPGSDACARAAPGETSHPKKRVTCPGSFPESRSGSLKENIPA